MPYVQRTDGSVTGLFANPQPGFAEEWLPDDAPEVVAYRAPSVPEIIARHQGLLALLEAGITEAAIRDALLTIEDTTERERFRIRFEQPNWQRFSPFIAWGQQKFAMTDAQVDDLFRLAATL